MHRNTGLKFSGETHRSVAPDFNLFVANLRAQLFSFGMLDTKSGRGIELGRSISKPIATKCASGLMMARTLILFRDTILKLVASHGFE